MAVSEPIPTKALDEGKRIKLLTQAVNEMLIGEDSAAAINGGRTAAEIAAGVVPANLTYPPGDFRRLGAALDGVTNNSPPLATEMTVAGGALNINYSESGDCRLDTDVTPAAQDIAVNIDPAVTFSGAGHLKFDDLIPYQHDPTWVQNLYRKTFGTGFNYYWDSFLLGSMATATGTARTVAMYGRGDAEASGARAWGGNFVGACTADGGISIGLEVDCQIVGAGNTAAAAYGLVIAASGDLPCENAIQIQAGGASASFDDGINFDLDNGDANITGALIRRSGTGSVSCERFLYIPSMSATSAEIDIPSFAVLATQVNTVNRLAVQGAATAANPKLSASGTDTNIAVEIVGKGTGGVSLIDGASSTKVRVNTTGIGFYGTTPAAKPTVTGSRGGNAALASLLTGLAGLGLLTDSTTA